MSRTFRPGLTKRGKRNNDAAARATAALEGAAAGPSRAVAEFSTRFIPVKDAPKRRKIPGEPKATYRLHNAPVLQLPGRQHFTQQNLPKAIKDGRERILSLSASGSTGGPFLTSEMRALLTMDGDGAEFFEPDAPDSPKPTLSRHHRRRVAQHRRWKSLMDRQSLFHVYLSHKYGSPETVGSHGEVACSCAHVRQVDITLADWDGSSISTLDLCDCTSPAERLLARGYFPCAPKSPSIAFSTSLLDFLCIHCMHVAPNVTAWGDTLEAFWARKGKIARPTGKLRKRLGRALTWYQALDNRAEDYVTNLIPGGAERKRGRYSAGDSERPSKKQRLEDESVERSTAAKEPREETECADVKDDDIGPISVEESAPAQEDAANEGMSTGVSKPSMRLRRCCPLCFGGDAPRLEHSQAHVIVCLDANFAQKRRRSGETDADLTFSGGRFLDQSALDAMAIEVEARRKQAPSRRRANGAAGRVGDEVLDACEQSFIAAQESVTKASKNYYADTGLMALLCRHDRVLWIANMNTPGERQHFALALLRKLGTELPATWRIGVLYDIGCQIARSIEKWGFLDELADRLIFGVSVFHAYGHQWSCQIVFHPRKRGDFGLSDGEGCERFWSAIRHLIACLRVSGFHRRLFVLDRQIEFMGSAGMWKLGTWLKKRYTDALRRRDEARQMMLAGGVSEGELSQQWEAQVKSHLAKPARQSKKAGDKAIEDILLAMGTVGDLKTQLREDRAELRKAHGMTSTQTAELTRRIEVARAELDATNSRITAMHASLGTEQCRRLEDMKGSAYICARVNARALRATIRQGIVMHKFEHRKLERAYRHQVLQAKDHSQTKDLVHRRERTLTGQIAKFNGLVNQMALLYRQGKKPPRARLPRKLDAKKIFTLDVDDDIWQEDPGLGPQDEGALPRWQTDDAVKRGILRLLEYRRCTEEIERVEAEARSLGAWWREEEANLAALCEDRTKDSSVRQAAQRRHERHLALQDAWTGDFRGAGLSRYFQEGISAAGQRSTIGGREGRAGHDPEVPEVGEVAVDVNGDDETAVEIDSDDASDAYSEPEDEDEPVADLLDDLMATDEGVSLETDVEKPDNVVEPTLDENTGSSDQKLAEVRTDSGKRPAGGTYVSGRFKCFDEDVDRMAQRRAWLSGDGLATFAHDQLVAHNVEGVSLVHSRTLWDVSLYSKCLESANTEGIEVNRAAVFSTISQLIHPRLARKWLIFGHVEIPAHWTLIEIRWTERKVYFYDSFACKDGYVTGLKERLRVFMELCDEFYQEDVGGTGFAWVGEQRGKRQTNTYDCGPFVAADAVSLMNSDAPSLLCQGEMGAWRRTMEERVRALRREGFKDSSPTTMNIRAFITIDSDDD